MAGEYTVDQMVQPKPFRRFSRQALSALSPPPQLPAQQWVAENVMFPAQSASVQTLYDFRAYPWHVGLWEAILDPSITFITLVWGTQLGKTAFQVAYIAYRTVNDPVPILVACPDERLARTVSVNKIQPVLKASRETKKLLPHSDHLIKDLEIDLRFSRIYFGWSGSASTLGEKSIGIVIKQELDKWTQKASIEGDPSSLAEERTKDFVEFKIIQDSTPTEEGVSRIWTQYELSDQRTLRVPCPTCGTYERLSFDALKMPHDKYGHVAEPDICLERTRYVCPHCTEPITDTEKVIIVGKGLWAREGEHVEKDGTIVAIDGQRVRKGSHAGFHLSSLYSAKLTWGRIGEKWAKANREGVGAIRNFVNGWLAEPFRPKARVTVESEVLAHRGIEEGVDYAKDTCPLEPIAVLLVADVQDECLYYQSWGVCLGKRFYMLRHGQLPGDLNSLEPLMSTIFTGPDDTEFRHTHGFIDSGHRTTEVYQFCRDWNWTATKGYDSAQREQQLSIKTHADITLVGIKVLDYKDALTSKIKSTNLEDPGCWMLHRKVDQEFARQMTSERRIIEEDKWGRKKPLWVQKGGRDNHYWDCCVIALAAADALEIQGFDFYHSGGVHGGARMYGKFRQ
jgi:phage terminase large subunit GpA-like protein